MTDQITPGDLLRALREYLAVHPGLALSGHDMDNMALDLARIATATLEPDGVDARLETWLTSGSGELHPKTKNLVVRFARALASKLLAAEKKYGYSDGWTSPDWMDECRQKLADHVAKGDPLDVAAYCAFLWHHDESTASAAHQPVSPQEESPDHAPDAGNLARMVDELRELAHDAKQAMAALVMAAIPDESQEGVPVIIPPAAFRRFVDAHAQMCFCMHQLGHNGPREQPQRYKITSIKYLAGVMTLVTVDGSEVRQELESGQVVTLK